MATNIKCPGCGNVFDVEEVIAADLEKKYQKDYQDKLQESMLEVNAQKKGLLDAQRLFDEKRKKENELFAQKLSQERQKMEVDIQEQLRKTISADFENQLRLLQQSNNENQEKLKLSRKKELEFLQKEQELKTKEAELEISVQKKLHEQRAKLSEEIRKIEEQKMVSNEIQHQLKEKEYEIQIESYKRLIDEMKRKQEQGSMQLQGEAQELLLEEILQNSFPFDVVSEVVKGKKGADCLLNVRNKFGSDCGKILFESKRTANWGKDWVDKLKQDRVNCGADIAVLVSQALPDKIEDNFELKDGIWICNFKDLKILTASLREGLIRVFQEIKRAEGKGDKVQLLYDYMTSHEFASQWKAVRDVFRNMKQSIEDEKRAMEKIWKNREKQLEKAQLNSDYIIGSIEGIAGKNSIDLNLLEGNSGNLLEE